MLRKHLSYWFMTASTPLLIPSHPPRNKVFERLACNLPPWREKWYERYEGTIKAGLGLRHTSPALGRRFLMVSFKP
jgi:hypothetical protein